jgi:molybdenum cofactor biosynthesis enzyme MoaA
MPLDAQNLWDRGKVLIADDMIAMLSREIAPLVAIPDPDPRAPATEYDFTDGGGRVGFIASVSRPFCLNCNRLRLTADGKLRYCLFAIEEDDVKSLMAGASDEEIAALIRKNLGASGRARINWQVRCAAEADVLHRRISSRSAKEIRIPSRRRPPRFSSAWGFVKRIASVI